MYKVTVVTDGKEYPLLNQVLRLENPTLKEYAGNSPDILNLRLRRSIRIMTRFCHCLPNYLFMRTEWRSSEGGA